MEKHKILFVCIHNSARSQMAEAFLNKLGKDAFIAESAGLEPGILNPTVVTVMSEAGIDISNNKTKSAFDLLQQGKNYHAVITVCDTASAERCPIFPGTTKRLAWSFSDPSSFKGTKEEIMEHTRKVRDEIKQKITDFIEEAQTLKFWI
ncbi:MAG TPA: arsenate reductase ArsC [Arachidicoccus soli]|nr:arsenate reductase ArsC [Arachidicoccus soli]